jgi:hypothetical protein
MRQFQSVNIRQIGATYAAPGTAGLIKSRGLNGRHSVTDRSVCLIESKLI